MAEPFELEIISMKGPVYEGPCLSLSVPTEKGPLVIEPGYTNYIGALSPAGVLKVVTPERTDFYAVFGGVVDVKRNVKVSLFTEEINNGYEIDLARAMAARDRNLDRIEKHEEGIDLIRAKIKLAKALVRIDVKRLSEGNN